VHHQRLGIFTLDPAAGEVVGPCGREQLDPKVMQVLLVLAQRTGRVVTRKELLETIWPDVVVGDDVVSRCIYQLRRHLRQAGGGECHAAMVETLPKRGYRLNCDSVAFPSSALGTAQKDEPVDSVGVPVRDAAVEVKRPSVRRNRSLGVGVATLLCAIGVCMALLGRDDDGWRDPLVGARFSRITDFEGVVPGVAMSRDGNQMAFLARIGDRVDAWISQAGTNGLRNLTEGRVRGIDNPVRTLGFTPDTSQVTTWIRVPDSDNKELVHRWEISSAGGQPRPYVVKNASEIDWSPDGKRLVYHPAAPGDPLIVANVDGTNSRQIYVAPYGVHCHFPVWSPDGLTIYFVQGHPPDKMDLWRIAIDGGIPERITFHDSRVSYPVFLDATTLLYLAVAEDGSGPWLHGVDLRSRVPHRISLGFEQYTSLAASADGRHMVATRTTPRTSLWRVPVTDRMTNENDAVRIRLPFSGGRVPRLGPDFLLFVSGDGSGMHRLSTHDNAVTEVWHGNGSRMAAGPVLDRAGRRIAFSVVRNGKTRLQTMNVDGSGLLSLAPQLQAEGAPAWSPDGDSILIAAEQGNGTQLFQVSLDGTPIAPLTADYSRDAVWSPDGSFLVYIGPEVGPQFHVRAMSADGRPRELPDIALPRGAHRLVFLPGSNDIVVLKGDARDRNFWRINLETGSERQLTDFESGFAINNFDVSADGREIVFDQLREESDVVRIDLAR
jgi:Tol biopolymer transport system component/DNA-binding winged helix-turn-helix (wHTH) protein